MKILAGKPLFLHTLEKLVNCNLIDEVYLDSESDIILDYADHLNYHKFKRDIQLSTNRTDGHKLFYNEISQVDADIYMQVLCTSPFIKETTIENCIKVLLENENYDSVVLVRKEKQYLWDEDGPTYDINNIPNSNDLPDTIIESMGLYAIRSEVALRKKMRIGDMPYLMQCDPIEGIDVNYQNEFDLANTIMVGMNHERANKLKLLSNHLSSAIFSDILKEYGINSTIVGLTPNISGKKCFGRANTIKLRRLSPNEDFRGIYNALKSYLFVKEGDIIIVETEVPEFAYFGDLNANLAIRSGSIATIINGSTRDSKKVKDLDYPVYSMANCCKDIKYEGTLESYNVPVCIKGVTIYPDDLVFSDDDGIVVIPKDLEIEIITKAIGAISNEKDIIHNILLGRDTSDIIKKYGLF